MQEASENIGCGKNPIFGGNFHPTFREARTTKKARFHDEEIAGDQPMQFEERDVIEENDGPMPSIAFSARIHEKLSEPWRNSVVVKLLRRTIGYRALCTRLNPWTPSFDFTKTAIDQVTVWIRLSGLTVHLYDRKILQRLGDLVGTVIKIDANTTSCIRGRFARVAVTISLDKPLVSQFVLDGKIQKVEYEELPVICFKCGRYGHNSNACKEAGVANDNENPPQPAMQRQEDHVHQKFGCHDASNMEPFGLWMIVTRRGRRTNVGIEKNSELSRNRESFGATTSRFHVLAQDSDEQEYPAHAVHTVVFCSPQALPPGDGRDVDIEHRDRQGTDPQHTSDPPDFRNTKCAITGENALTLPKQSRSGADEAAMSEEEETMVQEMLMALMADIIDQQN
ncbi:hypothetical protein WN943_011420 [Citrus x changshan-huyou]